MPNHLVGSHIGALVLVGVGLFAGCGSPPPAASPESTPTPVPPASSVPAAPTAAPPAQTPPAAQTPPPAPTTGAACVGTVRAAPAGAREVEDAALLKSAIADPGQGKLCTGKVFEATAPIKVYRVWTAAKAYTEIGGWWSFDRPTGPVAKYREANDICPEWSTLDTVSSCTIKAGARFVVGPGQSADCADHVHYAASAENQVFVPNDTRAGKVYVDGCQKLGTFP